MTVKIIRFAALYIIVSFMFLSFLLSFAVDIVTYPNSEVKQCDVAVVEGWLYDDQIDYFQKQLNSYETIYTIGAKFERAREYFPYDNLAELMKDRLSKIGIEGNKIVAIVSDNKKDRTLNAMVGLKDYLSSGECIDLYTHQRHSYRSYLNISYLFPTFDISVFYKKSEKLIDGQWLKESNEFKEVIMELISIVYTKIKLTGE